MSEPARTLRSTENTLMYLSLSRHHSGVGVLLNCFEIAARPGIVCSALKTILVSEKDINWALQKQDKAAASSIITGVE